MAALIALNASIYLGIGNWWQGQEIVKKYPMLRWECAGFIYE